RERTAAPGTPRCLQLGGHAKITGTLLTGVAVSSDCMVGHTGDCVAANTEPVEAGAATSSREPGRTSKRSGEDRDSSDGDVLDFADVRTTSQIPVRRTGRVRASGGAGRASRGFFGWPPACRMVSHAKHALPPKVRLADGRVSRDPLLRDIILLG